MRFVFASVIAAGVVGLAGCVTVAPPAPATLTFDRTDCTAVDLTKAVSLTPPKEQAVHYVSAPVDHTALCAAIDGVSSTYALFAIPADSEDKTLTVGAYLEPLRVLSPAVKILDAEGRETRRFKPDEFMYRGMNYSILFRPRANERFVMVSSDPSRVGQRYDSIIIGTSATTAYTGYGTATFVGGVDSTQSRVFSYDGLAQVTVNDADTKEENAAAKP
ncbi:MalM family protein [Brevundimonas sp. SGAir0440]|uniref:MalM family protein n=1 Tax=Brevundimonas sp. SGAir0440 TaxID=2579977 RepID=UPI00143CF2C9|nr:MalM family protein [Brevundimonas sp. SGAir0440]